MERQDTQDVLLAPISELSIDRAHPAKGEHVVDIGCGCGATTIELGRRVGRQVTCLGWMFLRRCSAGRAGWWNSTANAHEKQQAAVYFGQSEDGVHWSFIRAAHNSVADLSIIPLQDVLGLDSNCRMNTPSRADGNWGWRFCRGALTQDLARKLAELVEVSDRQPKPVAESAARQQRHWETREDFAA